MKFNLKTFFLIGFLVLKRGRNVVFNKKNKGVTLIEAIIAILILAMTLAASGTLMVTTTRQNSRNRDRMVATYLAQECMELTRNVRDSAWRKYQPWDCGFFENDFPIFISGDETTVKKLVIFPTPRDETSSLISCANNVGDFRVTIKELSVKESARVKFGVQTNFAEQKETPFYRYIRAKRLSKDKIQLTCKVYWGADGNDPDEWGDNEVSMTHILTDWKKL